MLPRILFDQKSFLETPFSQQTLPAWQPILTAGTVFPAFFCIGVAFIAIGGPLLYFSDSVLEKTVDYTDCTNTKGEKCHELISNDTTKSELSCICEETFKLEDDGWDGSPIYMYYGLTNFYQNHRRYVKSRDEKQLLGNIENPPDKACDPYGSHNGNKTIPCGAIANSLFSGKIMDLSKKITYVSKISSFQML